MRKLVLSLGGLVLLSSTAAFATCPSGINTDAIACNYSEREIYCFTHPNAYNSSSCGLLQNSQFQSSASDETQVAAEFQNFVRPISDRSQQCCTGNQGTSCDGVPQPSHVQPSSANGIPQTQALDAQAFQEWGAFNASLLGVCEGGAKFCQDIANKANLSSCPSCSKAKLVDVCKNHLLDPSSLRTSANDLFDKSKQSSQAGKGTQSAPGADGADKDKATRDGTTAKKNKSNNGGMGQMLSSLAPMLQQLMQQQQDQNAQDQQMPEMPSVQCGPGVISPQCQQQAAAATPDSFNKANPGANFETASKNAGFNPGDGPTPGTGKTGPAPVDASQQQAMQTTQVPNGGGQMLGGQGGGGGASLGGGGGGGAQVAAAAGPKVDANQLSSHSAFATMNQGMSTAAGGSGGFSSYGKTGSEEPPLNYADFLPKPGQPVRALAGAGMKPMMQIQSKEVNIWNRISDHIKQRCSLGLLRDCVP